MIYGVASVLMVAVIGIVVLVVSKQRKRKRRSRFNKNFVASLLVTNKSDFKRRPSEWNQYIRKGA